MRVSCISKRSFIGKVFRVGSADGNEWRGTRTTHPLLLHELGVGAVVDNILSEDGSGQDGIDLLGVDVAQFSVQDEVVALAADADGGLLAEKDEGEDIAMLRESQMG